MINETDINKLVSLADSIARLADTMTGQFDTEVKSAIDILLREMKNISDWNNSK